MRATNLRDALILKGPGFWSGSHRRGREERQPEQGDGDAERQNYTLTEKESQGIQPSLSPSNHRLAV